MQTNRPAAPVRRPTLSRTPDRVAAAPTVALLLQSDGPGGAEFMVLHHAVELARLGHRVIHVGPAHGCGWLAERMVRAGIETTTFEFRHRMDAGCLVRLVQLFRRERVVIAHSHEFEMAVYGAAAARLAGVRHVITMHGGRYYADEPRRRTALRWACRLSGSVVGVSERTARCLESDLDLPPGSVTVVPNGVPLPAGDGARVRRDLGLAADELLLLAVGNLYPVKGHRVLLEAAARLARSTRAAWRVAIAGRGEEEPHLAAFIAEHGLAARVHLLGYRDDVADLLDAADVWVMPSFSEGLPLALLEAMRAGKAIVASRVGGIPEVVADRSTGLLVGSGDAAALAEALHELIVDAQLRSALGRNARAGSTRFSVEEMTSVYRRLYGAA
jgi:glycosyltransferase involved in cell wall biosynthesis